MQRKKNLQTFHPLLNALKLWKRADATTKTRVGFRVIFTYFADMNVLFIGEHILKVLFIAEQPNFTE